MSNDKVINQNVYKPYFEFSQKITADEIIFGLKNREKAIYVSYKQIPCSYDMYFEEETFQTQKQKVEGKYMYFIGGGKTRDLEDSRMWS